MPASNDGSNMSGSTRESQDHNALEWAVSAMGALITVGAIVYLIVQIITGAGDPPVLRITLGTPSNQAQSVLVPVTVSNEGGSVASDVVVEVCTGTAPCSQLTFRYVPHEAERSGRVGFEAPIDAPLDARIVSYRLP